jgi:hypothetical protein
MKIEKPKGMIQEGGVDVQNDDEDKNDRNRQTLWFFDRKAKNDREIIKKASSEIYLRYNPKHHEEN